MISHPHRTVFIHIPKCGGQSIETAFLADLGLDWSTRAPLLLRLNNEPRLGPHWLAHLRAGDYVRYHYLSAELFREYYVFSLVRCPLARAVSLFNYVGRGRSLDTFFLVWLPAQFGMGANGKTRAQGLDWFSFVRPQVDFLSEDGTRLVEHVVRLEELDDALPEIRRRSGLTAEVGHVNNSIVKARQSDLEPVHLRMIERLYRDDFEFLGYPTPSDAGLWSGDLDAQESARRRKAERKARWSRARMLVRRAWKPARRM